MGRQEGGGEGVNEGKGRASSRRERASEPETDWEMQRERGEREKTQLTLFQATPLSNSPGSACVPLAGWQHASQSHAWLLSQSGVSLQLCILDFIFTMATQPCSWPWDVACVVYTHTHACTHTTLYIQYKVDQPLMSSGQSNYSRSSRDINKAHMADKLTQLTVLQLHTCECVAAWAQVLQTVNTTGGLEYKEFIQHRQTRKMLWSALTLIMRRRNTLCVSPSVLTVLAQGWKGKLLSHIKLLCKYSGNYCVGVMFEKEFSFKSCSGSLPSQHLVTFQSLPLYTRTEDQVWIKAGAFRDKVIWQSVLTFSVLYVAGYCILQLHIFNNVV